ncbi:MAG: hypothetical protein H6863_06495 [Rhodospirillales bacterium]|nr:hypothetical protein [Rhodospirillales bacterium]
MRNYYSAGGGCCCGTSERTARINRGISFYLWRNIPTPELEQTIGWLDDIRRDCDYKISEIEAIISDRQRTEKWRKNINSLARQFYDPDSIHLDIEARYQIVMQRLDVQPHIARHIAERVHTWAKRKRRENRNAQICLKHDAGTKKTDLAREYGISRQQVHNILKNRRDRQYFK